jgi:DNA-binding IclR family transcriptional regulator
MVCAMNASVPSVERALTVFEFLANTQRGFSLSEISQRLCLPKSSVSLLLATLERRGYLQKSLDTGRYRFGVKVLALNRSSLDNLELRHEARPFLESLVSETNLTVHMAVLEQNEAIIIEKLEPPGSIKIASWIGRRIEINCTALGKALVAFLPASEFEQQVKIKTFIKHNHKTITSINLLKEELVRVRKFCYAIDDEEEELGCRCVGAPLFDGYKKVLASISVSGTTSQIPIERIPPLARRVKLTAQSISAHLGYEAA